MQDDYNENDGLQPSNEVALASFEPQYAMVAKTEAGYLDIAAKLSASGLLPKDMSEQKAAICMMAGGEYGLSPLKSINGFAVINNRVTPFGVTLRGICEDASLLGDLTGHVEGLGEIKYMATEEIEGGEVEVELGRALQRALRRRLARLGWVLEGGKWSQTEQVQIPGNYRIGYAVLKRRGRPVRVELFDSKEAHQGGLIDRTDIWRRFQPRMLEHRAMTFALRALYADKLSGLPATVEEIDVIDTTATEVSKPAAAVKTVLDELAAPAAATPAKVEDAEFTERAKAAPAAAGPASPPPSSKLADHGFAVEARERDKTPQQPKPAAAPKAPPEPPFDPTGDAPAAAPAEPAPASRTTGPGAKALKAACDMIKAGGGDIAALSEAATQKLFGQVKSSRSMNDDEKAKVAAELGETWRAKREAEERARREAAEAKRPVSASANDDDVDF